MPTAVAAIDRAAAHRGIEHLRHPRIDLQRHDMTSSASRPSARLTRKGQLGPAPAAIRAGGGACIAGGPDVQPSTRFESHCPGVSLQTGLVPGETAVTAGPHPARTGKRHQPVGYSGPRQQYGHGVVGFRHSLGPLAARRPCLAAVRAALHARRGCDQDRIRRTLGAGQDDHGGRLRLAGRGTDGPPGCAAIVRAIQLPRILRTGQGIHPERMTGHGAPRGDIRRAEGRMGQARIDALPGAAIIPPQSRRRPGVQDGPIPTGRRGQAQHGLSAQPDRLPRARVHRTEKRQGQQRRQEQHRRKEQPEPPVEPVETMKQGRLSR